MGKTGVYVLYKAHITLHSLLGDGRIEISVGNDDSVFLDLSENSIFLIVEMVIPIRGEE